MNWDAAILVVLKLLGVLALVLLNGFFVAAEFALVRIRETQLDMLVAKGSRRARLARHIIHHINSYLSATQLGITMVSLGLGYLGEPLFASLLTPLFHKLGIEAAQWVKPISFIIGFSVLTFLSVVIGELAPKWLTIQRPLPVALWAAHPLRWFYLAFYPLNRLLNVSARFLLRTIGLEPDASAQGGHSEEELRLVLGSAQSAAGGRNIILNALDLKNRTVREVMRPRQEIVAFNTDAPIADCVALAEKTRYSRYPVCEGGDLDKTRGVIHIKDLYPAHRDEKNKCGRDLLSAARKLIYVPETARVERLLQLFLERKSHFAIVVDEFGGTLGMVTLENALETLVGQIQDEFDSEKSELVALGDNIWEATGTLPLHELEKITGEIEHDDSVATASGWLTQKLGGFPKVGDTATVGRCELRVEEMDGARVARLKVTRRPAEEGDTVTISRRG